MYTNYTPLHYSSTVRGISIRCMLMYKMVGTTVYERERDGFLSIISNKLINFKFFEKQTRASMTLTADLYIDSFLFFLNFCLKKKVIKIMNYNM